MTFAGAFLVCFPACALFVGLAVIVEREWRAEDEQVQFDLYDRLVELCETRARIEPKPDTRPMFLTPAPVPWRRESWL